MGDEPTVRISIPATEEDITLYGTDPYYSARSWHEAWMKSQERVAELERVVKIATEIWTELHNKIVSRAYDDECGMQELLNSINGLNLDDALGFNE